jgi:hypothetical protein
MAALICASDIGEVSRKGAKAQRNTMSNQTTQIFKKLDSKSFFLLCAFAPSREIF